MKWSLTWLRNNHTEGMKIEAEIDSNIYTEEELENFTSKEFFSWWMELYDIILSLKLSNLFLDSHLVECPLDRGKISYRLLLALLHFLTITWLGTV